MDSCPPASWSMASLSACSSSGRRAGMTSRCRWPGSSRRRSAGIRPESRHLSRRTHNPPPERKASMHVSIWKFTGDPDELTACYDELLGEFPTDQLIVHLCLRDPDGIVVVDTCPSREAFEA